MKKLIFVFLILNFQFSIFNLSANAQYKRIVSLAPSVTESLYELGAGGEVVGITVYCPKGESKKEIVGTLLEPDFEKIIALKPDLIVSTMEGNSKAAVEKLMRLGLNVYTAGTSQSFEEICANYFALAQKIGKGGNAAQIIKEARENIEVIYNNIAVENTQSVFWEVGAKPLYTAGKQSFVNDYNRYAKTENIYKDLNARYPQIDVESVLSKNPDIIVLVSMGDITESEIEKWKKYKTLKAVKNNRIFMLDANDIFTPTPKTFANGVKILAEKIFNLKIEK